MRDAPARPGPGKNPTRRKRKQRRPEAHQYARHPDTGQRVRVYETTPCGEPLPYPEVLGPGAPPCFSEPDEEDEDLFYPATDTYQSEEDA